MGFQPDKKTSKMKPKYLSLVLSMFFILTIIAQSVNAEVTAWNLVSISETEQTATYVGSYQLDDTSADKITRGKAVQLALWYSVQELPFNLQSYGGEVDWCNFTTNHYIHLYDSEGNLINTTTETTSLFFQSSNFSYGTITFYMKANDIVTGRMRCHYTNVSALQMGTKGYSSVDEAIVGRFDTLLPAFECDKCEGHTLEDLTNEFEQVDERTANELQVYDWVQTLVRYNYQLWTYASWIIKIIFILVAFGLVFAGVYWIYDFFSKLARKI